MKNSWFAIGISTGLVLGAGCHKPREQASVQTLPVMPVHAQKVESKPSVAVEEVVGTVRAKLRAAITAKVTARIEKMLVVPGQQVRAGEPLIELDAREIQARLDNASAVKNQAEIELKRMTTLFERGTVARAEVDRAEMNSKVAEANVAEANTMVSYAKVTAPFSGVITRKIADVGDLASPGQAVLEMEDPGQYRLEADVPEALIGKVKLGEKFAVRIPSLSVVTEAQVGEMDPAADPNSRTFNVKLDLPPGAGLRSGLYGRMAVPVSETRILKVPASALVVRGQMEIVFVIQDNRAQLRLVKTGKRTAQEVELLSGVTDGEMVVADKAAQLADAQPVQVQ